MELNKNSIAIIFYPQTPIRCGNKLCAVVIFFHEIAFINCNDRGREGVGGKADEKLKKFYRHKFFYDVNFSVVADVAVLVLDNRPWIGNI